MRAVHNLSDSHTYSEKLQHGLCSAYVDIHQRSTAHASAHLKLFEASWKRKVLQLLTVPEARRILPEVQMLVGI